jgi:uncharacterized C2H2 Zn-finger protein
MPKIKAYKGAGKIIPVEEAIITTAFRCPWTQKVYGNKRDYVKHLKYLRENYMHKRIRAKVVDLKKQNLWNQPTFVDIVKWIEMNPEFMFDNGFREGWHVEQWKKYRDQFWIKITYLDLRWDANVSNSHSCPRGEVTNWGRREEKPSGYPGYTGRIEYETSHDIGFGSEVVRGLGIHTGTGGGGGKNRYGFDVKFFDADWPGLVSARTMDILADNNWRNVRIGEPRYFC